MVQAGDPVPYLGIQLERTDSSVPVPIKGSFAWILGIDTWLEPFSLILTPIHFNTCGLR
jgi:hypothetical protein